MSDSLVTLTIEGMNVRVPAGTLIVDAAKRAGIDIPVFCYHPKLEPVGMCRMCLVEIGRPRRDRSTGEVVRGDDGQAVIDFSPKLETACTTPVGEGWVVRGLSEAVRAGRREILEFLLPSHPLAWPICDPVGGVVFLDRERCIQGGSCVRFQEEIVGEPVIGFSERGRQLEIATFSNPGFDSIFSGNTADT